MICAHVCYSSAFFWLSLSTHHSAVFGALRGRGESLTGSASSSGSLQMIDTARIIDRNDLLDQMVEGTESKIPCPGPYSSRDVPEVVACNAANQFVFEVVQGYHCCTLESREDSTAKGGEIVNKNSWNKIHQTIDGDGANDQAGLGEGNGNGVVFSGDGKVVVVSARFNNQGGKHAGQVRVFHETDFGWQQLGQTLVGDSPGEFFGFSIAVSYHGSIIAIGTTRKKGPHMEAYQGRVQVYQLSRINGFKEEWDKHGYAVDGGGLLDYFGYSVALSNDGLHLAVGAVQHSGGSSLTHEGYVRVYQYNERVAQWEPFGEPMIGKESGEQQGSAISMSGNGRVVAVAARLHSGPNGLQSGAVRVYLYQHSGWQQIGSDLSGVKDNDQCGSSVALSEDGTVVAVGAEKNSGENKMSSGHVRVYRYQMDKEEWVQLGQTIEGDGAGHGSGVSVSIGGNVLAIGAIHAANPDGVEEAGQVRLFRFQTKEDVWEQIGPAIYGEQKLDHLGHAVSLTQDGSRLAIGVPHADTRSGPDSGSITMYEIASS